MSLEQEIQFGLKLHRKGQLARAEKIYRKVLARVPNQPEALHLLGVISRVTGKHQAAVELIQRALALRPKWPEAWYNLGHAYREAGQPEPAISAYRKSLEFDPWFADAHISLGNLLSERQAFDEAIASYQEAVALRPEDWQVLGNFGNALLGQQRLDEAIAMYERAIALQPRFHQAISNLGIAMKKKGRLQEAAALQRQAMEVCPGYPHAHLNLGKVLQALGNTGEAAASFREAINLKPDFRAAHVALGHVLRESGQLDEAISAYVAAIHLKADSADVYTVLGNCLKKKGLLAEAVVAHRRAIELEPEMAEAHSNLGAVLRDGWLIDEAIAACERAIALQPDFGNAYGNLSQALMLSGQVEAGLEASRRVISLQPENAAAHGGYVFSLNYLAEYDAAAIAREQAIWNDRHAEPLRKFILPHRNDPDPERRLRIGYVSADFWAHPVGRFLLPLLENHDKERHEIFAFSQATISDPLTAEFMAACDGWTSVVGLSDEQMAERVRQDGIDILVDLSLHTAGNRLLVFARQPAPVQITWLGYPGSTGLKTMDYRISDPYLDPAGTDLSIYSEKTLTLPDSFWCYRASPVAGEVAACPARAQGRVTFGCLNHFGKVTPPMLRVWMRLLQNLPEAVILLHVTPGISRQRVLDLFAQEGIDPQRVQFEGRVHPRDYFQLYGKIDIALDTSPFAGGTTTCDALWMGVPVVTMRGQTVIGRGGVSILANVGLTQLVAESEEQYVQIATGLAGDIGQLERWRSELRGMMQASPLMDAPRFARNMEAAYRTAWRQWCEAHESNLR
jgi:protein O-GlcNAc transferase